MNRNLIAGDLIFGLCGDPRGHAPAMIALDEGIRLGVAKARRAKLRPKAVKKVAKKVAKKVIARARTQRATVARARLAMRPKPAVTAAKRAAAALKRLPKPVAKVAVKKLSLPPRPTAAGAKPAPSDEQLQDLADATFADEGYDLETDGQEVTEPSDTDTDLATPDLEDDPGDLDVEEPEDEALEVDEMSGDVLGWNPIKAIASTAKKAVGGVKSVGKALLTKKVLTAGAAGLTLVCPAAGAPALAALAVAGKVQAGLKSAHAPAKSAAVKVVAATVKQAAKRDPKALAGVAMVAFWAEMNRRGVRQLPARR